MWLSAAGRKVFGAVILQMINAALVLLFIVLVIVGGLVIAELHRMRYFMAGRDFRGLPISMIVLGLLSTIVCVALARAGLHSVAESLFKARSAAKNLRNSLLASLVFSLASLVLGLVSFIMSAKDVDDAFDTGIGAAIEKYSIDIEQKEAVDRLQLFWQCCGTNGYADWFRVQWVKDGLLSESVPFSCCDPNANRPCIHHRVRDDQAHHNYNHLNQLTLNRFGCKEVLVTYIQSNFLFLTGSVLLVTSALQVVAAIVARYLQTSLAQAVADGDLMAKTPAYLLIKPKQARREGTIADIY